MIKNNRNDCSYEIFLTFVEFVFAALILICCGCLIYLNVHEPSMSEIFNAGKDFIAGVRRDLAPEPREQTTFAVLSLLTPIICAGVIYMCGRLCSGNKRPLTERFSPGLMIGMNVFILALISACLLNQRQFMCIMFAPVWGNYVLPVLVLLLSMMMIYALFRFDLNLFHRRFIYLLLFLIPLIQIFCCRLYTLDRIDMNQEAFHLNIIAYALSQAANGAVDCHQYGFYARMTAPLFKLIAPSVFNISVVMGILFFIACLSIYWVMSKCVKNKILLIGFALMLFLSTGSWSFLHMSENMQLDPYYAYYPLRFIFPALSTMLFFCLASFRKGYLAVLCGITAGIGLFWNLDSGIPIVGALAAVMLFQLIFSRDRRHISKELLLTVGAGCLTVIALMITFSIQQGGIFSLEDSLKYVRIFSSSGFMMIPMPGLPAPWAFFIGIYLLSIIVGLRSFMSGRFELWAKMSVFIAVLGIGLFAYYQGRSHIYNLPSVIWPSLLLLFIYTDRISRLVRLKFIDRRFMALALPAVFFIACSMVTVVCDSRKIAAGIGRTCRGIAEMESLNPVEENVRFILKNIGDNKVVNIMSDMQGIYYAETGLRAGIDNFGMVETLLEKDRIRIANELQKAKYPLFISICPGVKAQVPAWVSKLYKPEAISNDGSLIYFTPLPAQSVRK